MKLNSSFLKLFILAALGILIIPTIQLVQKQQDIRQRALNIPELSFLSIGYTIHNFTYRMKDGATKALTIAIWYPAVDAPKTYYYNRGKTPGKVAVDGRIDRNRTGAPYPLVVFSHGYTGCGTQSAYITQYLASRGYIVAAPDHEDAFVCTIKGGKGQYIKQDPDILVIENFPERPTDLSAVIDEMLRLNKDGNSIFYQAINENTIGVSGHSLGGWNAQVVSGAIEEYKDSRIKAALLLAPSLADFELADFGKMDIPVMYLLGEKDLEELVFGGKPRRMGYDNANPPKFLPVVKDAGHFDFADTVCNDYDTIDECQKLSQKAGVILYYSLAFFDRYLKNENNTYKALQFKSPLLTTYEYQF